MSNHDEAVKAAYKVTHHMLEVEKATIDQIEAALEQARLATIDRLARATKTWDITQAQQIVAELDRQMLIWGQIANGLTSQAIGQAATFGQQQVYAAITAAGIEISTGVHISTAFVAVAQQTLPILITGISRDTVQKVANLLRQGVLAQKTPFELMGQIGTVTGAGVFHSAFTRGEFIVRSEMSRTAQTANQATLLDIAAKVPGMQKEWSAEIDKRTRPSHAAADGQRVNPDEPFMVGGWPLDYPCDPGGPAWETVNCRCISVPYHPSYDAVTDG